MVLQWDWGITCHSRDMIILVTCAMRTVECRSVHGNGMLDSCHTLIHAHFHNNHTVLFSTGTR